MSRPRLHNDESTRKSRGRPVAVAATELTESFVDTTPNTSAELASDNDSTLESFLMSKKKEEKEPVRMISFRMPESLFRRFENLRGEMSRTDYLLCLVEYADEARRKRQ